MAYENTPPHGAPQDYRDYRAAESRSSGGLVAALVIILALIIGSIALFSGGEPASTPVNPPVATDPVVPDAATPDAAAPAVDPAVDDGAAGDPVVPAVPAEPAPAD